jgi:hypothetical protein
MVVRSPQIALVRLIDLADEIDLSRLEAERLELLRARSGAVRFESPPATLELGPRSVAGRTGHLSARLYDFGVAALRLRLDGEGDGHGDGEDGRSWTELAAELDRLGAALELDRFFETEAAGLEATIGPALLHPVDERLVEEFAVVLVPNWEMDGDGEAPRPPARNLLADPAVAGLVLGESLELSDEVRRELDRFAFSYGRDDLAVLGFDRVLIVDPEEIWDVADLVELAHAELVELRFYDRVLAEETRHLPSLLDRPRGVLGLGSGHRGLRVRLIRRVAEITEVSDRLRRALTVTEDLFYAKVYRTALSLYGVTEIAETLDGKVEVLSEVYDMLTTEASTLRTELLELGIFLLVLIEVVKAFL